MTILDTSVPSAMPEQRHPADSAAAERLWNALLAARADGGAHSAADLEDAAFRFYLPMTRSVTRIVFGEDAEGADSAQRAAELGLARAILAWQEPSAGGFRRYARSMIIRHIAGR